MKKIINSLLIVVAAVFASCSTHQEVVPGITAEDAISFGAFFDQATKGTITDDTSVMTDDFGIMAYYTKQVAWADAAATATPNLMYNQQIEYIGESETSGAYWTYSPTKYWSNISGDNYSFFAYAPYQTASNGIVLSGDSAVGVPTITFTIQDEALNMIDLVAGQEVDVAQQTEAVKFDLKHQLTRVMFSAKTDIDDESTSVLVNSMSLVGAQSTAFYKSGLYTFDVENTTGEEEMESPEGDHEQDGAWTYAATDLNTGSYSFTSLLAKNNLTYGKNSYAVNAVEVTDDQASLFTSGEYLFLLPPNGDKGISSDKTILFQIDYQIITVDSSLSTGYYLTSEKNAIIALPESSLKQGKAYNIILTVDLEAIKVTADVLPWDEDEDYNINSDGEIIVEDQIVFDETPLNLYVEETGELSVSLAEGVNAGDIIWSVVDGDGEESTVLTLTPDADDNSIVSVFANLTGSAYVVATIGDYSASCLVTVYDTAEYSISISAATMTVETTAEVVVEIEDSMGVLEVYSWSAGDQTVTRSTSDPIISFTVSDDYLTATVTALKAGEVTLVATLNNGETLECDIKVVDGIVIDLGDIDEIELTVGDEEGVTLTPSVSGGDEVGASDIEWSVVSDPETDEASEGVITISKNEDGSITIIPVAAGTAYIKAVIGDVVTYQKVVVYDPITIALSEDDDVTLYVYGAQGYNAASIAATVAGGKGDEKIVWTASEEGIVTITETEAGVDVEAVAGGVVTLTATIGEVSETITIISEEYIVNPTEEALSVYVGDTLTAAFELSGTYTNAPSTPTAWGQLSSYNGETYSGSGTVIGGGWSAEFTATKAGTAFLYPKVQLNGLVNIANVTPVIITITEKPVLTLTLDKEYVDMFDNGTATVNATVTGGIEGTDKTIGVVTPENVTATVVDGVITLSASDIATGTVTVTVIDSDGIVAEASFYVQVYPSDLAIELSETAISLYNYEVAEVTYELVSSNPDFNIANYPNAHYPVLEDDGNTVATTKIAGGTVTITADASSTGTKTFSVQLLDSDNDKTFIKSEICTVTVSEITPEDILAAVEINGGALEGKLNDNNVVTFYTNKNAQIPLSIDLPEGYEITIEIDAESQSDANSTIANVSYDPTTGMLTVLELGSSDKITITVKNAANEVVETYEFYVGVGSITGGVIS